MPRCESRHFLRPKMSESDWPSISGLAREVGCDKAFISRFVAKHKIKTRPGPKKSKLVRRAEFARDTARKSQHEAKARFSLKYTAEAETARNRDRLERLSIRRMARGEGRKRRSSI